MNIEQTIFILAMIICITLTMMKYYQLATILKWIDGKSSVIISFVFYISYTIMFIIMMIETDKLIITQLYKLGLVLFYINVMFNIVEIFMASYLFMEDSKKTLESVKGFRKPQKYQTQTQAQPQM